MPGVALLSYPLLGLSLLSVLAAALLVATLHFWQGVPAWRKTPRSQKHREIVLQQMAALAQRLRELEPGLDPKPILELPLVKLAQKLQAEELSLESILCSYSEERNQVKVAEGAPEGDCLADFLGECEKELQVLKKLKKSERGLLYGVPICLKGPYDCMGHDSTCGLAQFLEKPAAEDGVIVKMLKAQGAILFMKTNIPQALLSSECSSSIYGQTLNPLNFKKTPGRFSRGEGALLAARGCILGMGSDTGGSIRTPASFCGVCGLQTTGNYLSEHCGWFHGPGLNSLVLSVRALPSKDMHQIDPTVPFMPFREEMYSSNWPLWIGYYESDGYPELSPRMARVMKLTSRLLQDARHEVIPFSVPQIEYAILHLYQVGLYASGGATLLQKLEGDIVDPSRKKVVSILCLPNPVKCFLAWILKHIEPRSAQSVEELCGVGTPKKLWEQHMEVEAYQQEFIAKWKSLDLDALLEPSLDPAFCIGYAFKASESVSYTILYNLLNFPVGVVPVTTVTLQEEEELAFYKGYYRDSSKRIRGTSSGCAVHRFAMGRRAMTLVHEGDWDHGQEP